MKNFVRSVLQLNPSPSCYPTISLQSAEVAVPKNDPKSVAYENRTKTAKCGGFERTGPRERISASDGVSTVRRFAREARGYWRFRRANPRRRMLVAGGLAEREGFEPSIRFPVYTLSKRAPSATRPPLRGRPCGRRGRHFQAPGDYFPADSEDLAYATSRTAPHTDRS